MKALVRLSLPPLAFAFAVLACSAAGFDQPETVEVVFLNVGQGDATLIRSPEGKVALIDGGRDVDMLALLQHHGVDSIDIVIASHAHADHISGLRRVISAMPVRYYMDNGLPHTTSTYINLVRTLQASDITYLEATERTISLGSVTLKVLPPPGWADHNNNSVGVVVEFGDFNVLLTGDSEVGELNYFLSIGVPDVTVLKAAHHGSRNGVSPAWLSATKPEVVVISCGLNNQYGHPHPWALRYYKTVASEIYRTDLDGEVTITAQRNGKYEVSTEYGRVARGEPPAQPLHEQPVERAALGAGLSLWVFADAPGNDHYNLNGEYVVVTNNGPQEISIGSLTLCDAVAHCFTFPAGASIRAGGQAVVYTGAGRNDGTNFFMNRGRAVWNNTGDVATLRDAGGRVVATYAY